MAAGAQGVKIINGAASTAQATAKSNFDTAMATFIANSGGTLYQSGFPPVIINSGVTIAEDATIANSTYCYWAVLGYSTAS